MRVPIAPSCNVIDTGTSGPIRPSTIFDSRSGTSKVYQSRFVGTYFYQRLADGASPSQTHTRWVR